MRFRIKQKSNGNYVVQMFSLFFWESAFCDWTGKYASEFESLEEAKEALRKRMAKEKPRVRSRIITEEETR